MVELVTTVAIVGILAALALPSFQEMQYKAKKAEAVSNVDGLFTALTIYVNSLEETPPFVTGYGNPSPFAWNGSVNGKEQRPWNTGVGSNNQESWRQMGWKPDGAVRCSYYFNTSQDPSLVGAHWAFGGCDIDGDGEPYWRYQTGELWVNTSWYPYYEPYGTHGVY